MNIDLKNSGQVTIIEFRKIIRSLKIGLRNTDIDALINACICDQTGYINWKDFLKKIQPRSSDILINNRNNLKVAHINALFYKYMNGPKEAFRSFNENRNGLLTFD